MRSYEISEFEDSTKIKRIAVSIAALALGASIFSTGTSEAASSSKLNHEVSRIKLANPNHNQVEKLRAIAIQAKAKAKLIAAQENASVKQNVKAAPYTTVLNGIISVKQNDGKILAADTDNYYLPTYANPYYLVSNGSNLKTNSNEDFLNGAWIGIASNAKNGNLVITPIKFDAKTMHFDQNKSIGNGPLMDVGVIMTEGAGTINGKVKIDILTPLAFDLNGKGASSTIYNDNDTFISPGRLLIQK